MTKIGANFLKMLFIANCYKSSYKHLHKNEIWTNRKHENITYVIDTDTQFYKKNIYFTTAGRNPNRIIYLP